MISKACDIAILGGGPAGLSAAQTAASNGASVILIDDAKSLGGHFFKELPDNFNQVIKEKNQKKLHELERRRQAIIQSGAEILSGTRVWGIFDENGISLNNRENPSQTNFSLYLDDSPEGIASVHAQSLILAPGVYDRPLPFSGWELPGVVTPGAVQMQIEKQGLLPGERVLVAGSGPLQMIVAAALAQHGVEVVALLDTCSVFEKVPGIFGALGGLWSRLPEAVESLDILVRNRVPMLFRHAVYRALGTPESGVMGAVIGEVDADGHPIPGTQREYQVDTICVAYGFIPSIAMTLHLGCKHIYDSNLQAFIPEHDENLQTSVPGVFVAGDVTGAGGKPLAILQGKLAAISALEGQNKITKEWLIREHTHLTPAIQREKRFAKWLWNRYRVRTGLLELADDETCICRCEAVSVGDVRKSMENGGQNLYGVKLRTRLGMGQCQGRYCTSNAALLLAAKTGKPVSQIGPPSIRPPIFPVRLKDIDVPEEVSNTNQ
jgi:NADPH-dependent 2,4-dienoyl-CoA reductase/sulfur reductase-like enzyme